MVAEKELHEVVSIAPNAMNWLRLWSYPGNVRELKNIMERAVALCPANVIQPEDLPQSIRGEADREHFRDDYQKGEAEIPEAGLNLDELLSNIEKKWLVAALNKAEGKKTKASELLQMSFRSFRYRLAKYGMDSDG